MLSMAATVFVRSSGFLLVTRFGHFDHRFAIRRTSRYTSVIMIDLVSASRRSSHVSQFYSNSNVLSNFLTIFSMFVVILFSTNRRRHSSLFLQFFPNVIHHRSRVIQRFHASTDRGQAFFVLPFPYATRGKGSPSLHRFTRRTRCFFRHIKQVNGVSVSASIVHTEGSFRPTCSTDR